MLKDKVYESAQKFSGTTHGSSDYDKDLVFVRGSNDREYAPLSYIQKELPEVKNIDQLKAEGFVFSSYDYLELNEFDQWYLNQFNKRLSSKVMKNIGIMHLPDHLGECPRAEVGEVVAVDARDHEVLEVHGASRFGHPGGMSCAASPS